MTEYPAGTVAMVTAMNRSVPFRAFFDGKAWVEHGFPERLLLSPTSVRPLVVLDLETVAPEAIVEALRNWHAEALNSMEGSTGWGRVADQIEAQTKPPRIPEPGLWGVVEASRRPLHTRVEYVRTQRGWEVAGIVTAWASLVDPTLVRPGIEDAS